MHWLDITLLVVLGIGALFGVIKGLLWQVARIVTFAVAIYSCIYLHDPATALLQERLPDVPVWILHLFTYVGIFLGVYLVLYGITKLLEKGLKKSKLKTADRLLGLGFGVLKASLVAGAVLMLVTLLSVQAIDTTLAESRVAPVLLQEMRVIIVLVPQDCKDEFAAGLERIRKAGEEKAREAGAAAARKAVDDGLAPPTPPVKKP